MALIVSVLWKKEVFTPAANCEFKAIPNIRPPPNAAPSQVWADTSKPAPPNKLSMAGREEGKMRNVKMRNEKRGGCGFY